MTILWKMINNYLITIESINKPFIVDKKSKYIDINEQYIQIKLEYCYYYTDKFKIVKILDYSKNKYLKEFKIFFFKYYLNNIYFNFGLFKNNIAFKSKKQAINYNNIYFENEIKIYNSYGNIEYVKKIYNDIDVIKYCYNDIKYIYNNKIIKRIEINENPFHFNYCNNGKTFKLESIDDIYKKKYSFKYTNKGDIEYFEYSHFPEYMYNISFIYDDLRNIIKIKIEINENNCKQIIIEDRITKHIYHKIQQNECPCDNCCINIFTLSTLVCEIGENELFTSYIQPFMDNIVFKHNKKIVNNINFF